MHETKQRGVLLIIALLLLTLLAGMALHTLRMVIINAKASANYSAQLEAQTKADAIAQYALAQFKKNNPQKTNAAPTPCNPAQACSIWNIVPPTFNGITLNIHSNSCDAFQKQFWRTVAQNYPHTADLQNMAANTYPVIANSTDGSQPSNPVASYFIAQVASSPYTQGSNTFTSLTMLIVAYATDAKAKAGAVREIYYSLAPCNTTLGAAAITSACAGEISGSHNRYPCGGNCFLSGACRWGGGGGYPFCPDGSSSCYKSWDGSYICTDPYCRYWGFNCTFTYAVAAYQAISSKWVALFCGSNAVYFPNAIKICPS